MKAFLLGRLKSVGYAVRGIGYLAASQRNAWVHAVATVAVCAAGVFVDLSRAEWLWVTLAIVLVWSAEAFNTAVELLADTLHPERHPGIGRAKDVAAAAVLIAALGALVIGLFVFLPHLLL